MIFRLFSINNEKKTFFGCFHGFCLFAVCQQCSALNQRCSEMFITESVMTRDVKIKVGCYSSDHRLKHKNLWISAENDWISMRAQPGQHIWFIVFYVTLLWLSHRTRHSVLKLTNWTEVEPCKHLEFSLDELLNIILLRQRNKNRKFEFFVAQVTSSEVWELPTQLMLHMISL